MEEPIWLAHGWAELGQKEIRGRRDNARIMSYYRASGHNEISHDEVPWCAAFVGACLERSGIAGTGSLLARSYLKWGLEATSPRIGAIAVLSRGRNPRQGHVGFLIGEDDKQIWLLGGNQSDRVSVAAYDKKRLLGLRWPNDGAAQTGRQGQVLFDAALAHVLKMEGGFTDDPVDPGGPTNKGITLGVFATWQKQVINSKTRSRLVADLKRISDATVQAIYWDRYWKLGRCFELAPALAVMHFDACVNHGVNGAIKTLQEAVGTEVDGEIGPNTRRAIAKQKQDVTLLRYAEIRRRRYRALKHFWRFGRGWLRRVESTLKFAQTFLRGGQGPGRQTIENNFSERGEAVLFPEDTENSDGKWWGHSMTIWGALVSAAATIVPALGPVIGFDVSAEVIRQIGSEAAQAAQAIVGVLGTMLAIYGRARARRPLMRKMVRVKL